jgi:GNAT superfamily N-acetyltransferase
MHNLIYENFFQHCRKITSQVPGMQVTDTDSLSISDCGLSCDTFNIICIRNPEKLSVEALLQARAHFEKKNFAYTFWAEDNLLTPDIRQMLHEAEIQITNREPGMLMYLHGFSPVHTNNSDNIRKVGTPEEVQHYAQIVARNWQPPDENLIQYYTKATPVILAPDAPAMLYVYYNSGIPVAALELFFSEHQTAGIFNLSTLQEYRGRGIGTALISYALDEAKKQGYTYAALQASEEGLRIYERLGFVTETYFYELHG